MVTTDQAWKWSEIFPRHSLGWLVVSGIVVAGLASRPQDVPQPARSAEPRSAIPPRAELGLAERAAQYAWIPRAARRAYEPLCQRIETPPGFVRVAVQPGGFDDWLRSLPIRPGGTPVLSGQRKPILPADSPNLAAVIDLQPGNGNLLNAANIVLRLRAEYLWASRQFDHVQFSFTNGEPFPWSRWAAGERPIVSGRRVEWTRGSARDATRTTFNGYQETLFRYSSVYSLFRDTVAVTDDTIQPGDVYVVPGRPGHAVLVLDVAIDSARRVCALLGQGGTPPQTFHVLRPSAASAWFEVRAGADALIPGWGSVRSRQLRRWPAASETVVAARRG